MALELNATFLLHDDSDEFPNGNGTGNLSALGGASNLSVDADYEDYYFDDESSGGASSLVTPVAAQVIHRIILPVICAFGILGILLTVIVLSRKHMFTSTNCYLMALAITDLMFLILLATTLADNRFVPYSNAFYIYQIYVTYTSYFMHIFMLASIWLTVMLAIERFIAICRPFLASKVCTTTKARIAILAIYVSAILIRLVNFWENRVESDFDPTTNTTLVYIHMAPLSENELYIKCYPWIVDVIVTSVIPFFLLVVLNVRLIWEVRKSTKYLQRNLIVTKNGPTTVAQKEELQITIMLISVIMVFFICQAPYVIYTAIVSIKKSPSSGLMLFRYITMLLLTLKSAINFILYCWFSEKFWATLKTLFHLEHCFCTRCKSRTGGSGSGSSYYNLRRFSSGATRDTTVI